METENVKLHGCASPSPQGPEAELEEIVDEFMACKTREDFRKVILSCGKETTSFSYDEFVDSMWFYDPSKHGMMPELGYIGLKLAGECGEIAEKIGKVYRDSDGQFTPEQVIGLMKECGDAMFYIVKLAHLYNFGDDDVKRLNYEKLIDRHSRGKMKGNGDDR